MALNKKQRNKIIILSDYIILYVENPKISTKNC